MSAPQWKPGDVALVQNDYGVWNTAILQVQPDGQRWVYGVVHGQAPMDWTARPLVVIDPEDRESWQPIASRVWQGNDVRTGHDQFLANFQKALRSLVTPPKPDEPQGLGAVVEDADGKKWSQADHWKPGVSWMCVDSDEDGTYADIAAVRVLSEGWSE